MIHLQTENARWWADKRTAFCTYIFLGVVSDISSTVSVEIIKHPWWKQFLLGINPINVEDWRDMAWYMKAYEVFKVKWKETKAIFYTANKDHISRTVISGRRYIIISVPVHVLF